MTPISEPCLSIRAVAELLGVHPETARKWCRTHKFPRAFHLPNGSGWRVPQSDVSALSGTLKAEKTEQPAMNPPRPGDYGLQLMQVTRRLDRIERHLEALGVQPPREPSGREPRDASTAGAATVGKNRPVLVNNQGKMLVFSSPEAQDAYVEAFVDWAKPYIDTAIKSQGMPAGIRSAYLAGLYDAKRGEKPVHRVDE